MYYIIVNPKSKTGKGINIWKSLEPVLTEKGIDYRVVLSKKAGHVTALVKGLCEKHLKQSGDNIIKLIMLGGDGTLNEALQGITDFERVHIGYIPTGSSNDMARDLKLPLDPVIALENILNCKEPYLMDIGLLTYNELSGELSRQHSESVEEKRFFGVSAGLGYDAAVCEEALASPMKNVLNKLGLGKLIYLFVALKQLIKTKNTDAVMTLDDETTIKLPGYLFSAAMIHQYEGGGFKFCPDADHTDGIFDIITAANISKLRVLTALPQAMKGNHFKYDGIERHSARKVHIETTAPCWVHTDGEVTMKSSSVTLECLRQKIRLLR